MNDDRTLRPIEWAAAALGSLAFLLLFTAPLSTPYWWDEAAVYMPGARWVAEHGFRAFPGVFPSDLARGHTTLFYVITAGAFAGFGTEPTVGHALALVFGAMGMVYTFALGTWLFGRGAGLVATLLLAMAPLWLTMSSQTLPEVPIAALSVASLYEMARGRYGRAAAWGVLVVLTKETGLACPAAIFGALGWRWLRERSREALRAVLWSAIPIAVLGAFFVWQRVAEGWWVLPYHVDLLNEEHSYVAQAGVVASSMFVADGRVVALVAAVVIGVVRWCGDRLPPPAPPASGRGDVSPAPPASGRGDVSPAPLASGRGDVSPAPPASGRGDISPAPLASGRGDVSPAPLASGRGDVSPAPLASGRGDVSPAPLASGRGDVSPAPLASGRGDDDRLPPPAPPAGGRGDDDRLPPPAPPASGRGDVFVAMVLLVLAYQVFFTKMWFLERYAIAAHPAIAIMLAGALIPRDPRPRLWLSAAGYLAVVVALVLALHHRASGTGYDSGETTFRYLDAIEAHLVVYRALDARRDPPHILTAWPMTDELRDPELGWVGRPYEVESTGAYFARSERPAIDAIVTSEGLGQHDALQEEARRLGMSLTQRAVVRGAVVELWERSRAQ